MSLKELIPLQQYATPSERGVTNRLVGAALKRGCLISVHDGEEWVVRQSFTRHDILSALCTTGHDVLRLSHPDGAAIGNIWLIWGNEPDGSELIADYTDNQIISDLVALSEGN